MNRLHHRKCNHSSRKIPFSHTDTHTHFSHSASLLQADCAVVKVFHDLKEYTNIFQPNVCNYLKTWTVTRTKSSVTQNLIIIDCNG